MAAAPELKPVADSTEVTATAPSPELSQAEQPTQSGQPASSEAPEQQQSGFWTGVMTGVLAALALVAFPVYDGVIKHRQSTEVLAAAQHQNLELRVSMAQKDLGLIEEKLAEIAALEAEFRAMQAQKDQLHGQRETLSNRLRQLQQQMNTR